MIVRPLPSESGNSEARTNLLLPNKGKLPKPAQCSLACFVHSRPRRRRIIAHCMRGQWPVPGEGPARNRVAVVAAAPTSSSVDDAPVDDTRLARGPSVRIGSRRVVLATAIVLAGTAGKALAAGKVVAGEGRPRSWPASAKARREKLKAAAAKMREKGKAESAFEESKFALGEDATTPNRVNRTGEGGSGI